MKTTFANVLPWSGALRVLSALLLAAFLTACENPVIADDSLEPADTAALEAVIAVARNEERRTRVGNATEIPAGLYAATRQVMDTFITAVDNAELTLEAAAVQATVNAAVTHLGNAILVFTDTRVPGEADPLEFGLLTATITEAISARFSVMTAASAAEVPAGFSWVTSGAMTIFETAIETAEQALADAVTQQDVDAARAALLSAILIFNNSALQQGTQSSGFSSEQLGLLIALAENARRGVLTTSANGNDVGPMDRWVMQVEFTLLNTAISNARTATNENRDERFLALTRALTAFNREVQTGTSPSKITLNELITNARIALEDEDLIISDSGDQVPTGSRWITQSQWDALYEALRDAVAVNNNMNATVNQVQSAEGDLGPALTAFENARQYGTGTEFNQQQLAALIAAAEEARENVQPGIDADDFGPGTSFVPPDIFAALNNAIADAQTATAANRDGRYRALAAALGNFNAALENGSENDGARGTLQSLIDDAADMLAETAPSENGDGVTLNYWAPAAAWDTFNNAITAAEAVHDTDDISVNAVGDATSILQAAINTFYSDRLQVPPTT